MDALPEEPLACEPSAFSRQAEYPIHYPEEPSRECHNGHPSSERIEH